MRQLTDYYEITMVYVMNLLNLPFSESIFLIGEFYRAKVHFLDHEVFAFFEC